MNIYCQLTFSVVDWEFPQCLSLNWISLKLHLSKGFPFGRSLCFILVIIMCQIRKDIHYFKASSISILFFNDLPLRLSYTIESICFRWIFIPLRNLCMSVCMFKCAYVWTYETEKLNKGIKDWSVSFYHSISESGIWLSDFRIRQNMNITETFVIQNKFISYYQVDSSFD